jgi:Raf kinase inhibitor-like YbhB/YbcL family protein
VSVVPEGGVPAGAVEGRNSWGRTGYGGPAPPSGTHRYFFKLYALDRVLDLAADTDKTELLEAMEGCVLARTQLMGTYSR